MAIPLDMAGRVTETVRPRYFARSAGPDESCKQDIRRGVHHRKRGGGQTTTRCHGPCPHVRSCCSSSSRKNTWGATSCYVTDNADLIFLRNGLSLLMPKLAKCIKNLSSFADEHRSLLTRLHTRTTSAANNGRQESLSLDTRLADGSP